MNPARCPGPGDLMPQYAGHPHDPRTPDADDVDDVDQCQDLIAKIRADLDMAETALFRRDMGKLRNSLENARHALEEALA
jgi:hypothetical protein